MAQLSRLAAALRLFGDDLVPDEVTKLLQGEPTRAYAKGDDQFIQGKFARKRKTGMWLRAAKDAEPGDLDGQVQEMLSGLTGDLIVWKTLSARFKMNIFCGLFMDVGNEGMEISPKTLLMLGEREIELWLDMYGPCED